MSAYCLKCLKSTGFVNVLYKTYVDLVFQYNKAVGGDAVVGRHRQDV